MSDTLSQVGPCEPYAVVEDLPDGCPCRSVVDADESSPSDDQLTELLAGATTIVWALLGRQPIGLCERRIHPCLRENDWRRSWFVQSDYSIGGLPSCPCGGDAVLLDGPVNDILEVIVNGEILEPEEYALVDGQWLERIGGSWPAGGEPGGDTEFSITYIQGIPVDFLVRDATIEVANALWADRCGVASCLPGKAVTSMTQAGVGYGYESDAERVKGAGEALGTLWRAIGIYNPSGAVMPTQVYSPDEPYRNRVVRLFASGSGT